jgi:hypothetical protein
MPKTPPFEDILVELDEMRKRKGADYGTENDPLADIRSSEQFGIPAWVNAVLRIQQKMFRMMSFVRRGNLINESVEDSLLDLVVYGIHALRLYREQKEYDETHHIVEMIKRAHGPNDGMERESAESRLREEDRTGAAKSPSVAPAPTEPYKVTHAKKREREQKELEEPSQQYGGRMKL